ncbi:MAG: M66 family metalloprotease [Nitrosopumilaceae archaeon]|nr:M66 family metalloprotease [Nitrosopumilaceae archaeon]
MLYFQARASTQEWHSQLQIANRYNPDNWTINYLQLTPENDSSDCDVIIKFEPKPKDPSLHYVALGQTQIPEKTGDPIIVIIYYQNIGLCKTQDQHYIYYNPCYTQGTFTERSIGNTVRHELGHAFGLGHYISDDMQLNKDWASGGRPSPSIMIITEHENPYQIMILPVDVEKLRSIYGDEGFAGNKREIIEDDSKNEVTFQNNIPDWIRNNAKWWSEESISDKDCASGIEYLISNKIIVLPEIISQTETAEEKIPDWIKQNAAWWSEGMISDDDFIQGLQYLVQHGIIRV